jgi:LuxR family maltose regulon positive regulatory protein
VQRDRLHHVVDDAVARGSLIVSAPAGSGKTQLVTGWMTRQRTPRAVAWLTLDEGDRDPLRFLRYVAAAMETTAPGREAMRGVSIPAAATVVNEALLLGVAEAMARLTDDVVLVLDDFDGVTGSETEELLARVLRYPPERVRLVVLGRAEPHLGQSRLGLLGYVTELGETDLAFTSGELVQLAQAHGIRMAAEELSALQTRTAGWAAGVALWVAGLAHGAASTGATPAESGEALAVDYLVTEVLAVQPDELRDFLRRATTTNPVCGELADVLTEATDGSRTLAELHEAHLFVTRLDDPTDQTRTWYRWHPLFAAAVQQQLVVTDPQLATTMQRSAARWHRRHGSPVEAVRYAMAGDDPEWAAELLGECWLDLVVAGESTLARSLLHLFDEHTRTTHAELAVICSFLRFQRRDLDRACRCAEEAVALSRRLPTRRQLAVEVMATVVRLGSASLTGVDRVEGLHETAVALLERIRRTRGYLHSRERVRLAMLLHQLGAHETSRWMVAAAHDHLIEARVEAETENLPDLVLRCDALLAVADLVAGRFGSAHALALGVVGPEQRRPCSPHTLATAYAALGGVELARGDIATALQHLSQAGEAVQPDDAVNRFLIGALTHFALHAAGRKALARAELERLESLVAERGLPPWVGTLLMVLRASQLAAEDRWVDALAVLAPPEQRSSTAAEAIRRCWRAEVLRLAGRPDEARAELVELLPAVPAVVAPLALVTDAVASEALGLHEAALESLDRALETAAPDEVLHPFLRLGPRVRVLLEQLVDAGTRHEAFAMSVLDRLDSAGRRTSMPSVSFEPLTAREREVLRAMQGTASNAEIAQRLFVSMNTLRTHLKHLNRKLGTASRREAVARARELSLL